MLWITARHINILSIASLSAGKQTGTNESSGGVTSSKFGGRTQSCRTIEIQRSLMPGYESTPHPLNLGYLFHTRKQTCHKKENLTF